MEISQIKKCQTQEQVADQGKDKDSDDQVDDPITEFYCWCFDENQCDLVSKCSQPGKIEVTAIKRFADDLSKEIDSMKKRLRGWNFGKVLTQNA